MKNKNIFFGITAVVTVFILITLLSLSITAGAASVRGDADGDGVVNTNDLVLLRQYFAGYDYVENAPGVEVEKGADANKDGVLNTLDIIVLRGYLVSGAWGDVTDITENSGVASVTTKKGLEYTATGYKSIENEAFVFETGLEIVFEDGLFADEFNRLNFEYYSSEPVKVFITYSLDGDEKTDYFFLEATQTSFRGLIEGYLKDKKGIELKKLTVETCEKTEGRFILENLETEIIPLYDDDLTVENDRYKIGCRLSWGGAMTYFEDKLDGDDALGNLVNIHDTGRLIQQSFYGTYTNDEGYTSVPNGDSDTATLWPYNPVQGGDRKNNGSDRLIDVEYDEENDYIYIVSQSLDWAYVKGLTYTYYENTYSIVEGDSEGTEDDYVLVDNVMTDFSGWEHPAGGQEIPAVYLVSYFDTLSYYNGIKPWTGDIEGIQYEENLSGWDNSGSFALYKGNTETWSIWINTEDNFGFGTYCPNIQRHIAIRHKYDGSKDPMANSTSYVAPSCSIVMESYKPVEYSYILATGDPEAVRDIFETNKDFTANPSLSENRYDQLLNYGRFDMMNMDFTKAENADIFYAPKHLELGYDTSEEALKITILDSRDPYASLNFDLNSDKIVNSEDFNTIEIEYMLPESNSAKGSTLVLFLVAGDQGNYDEKRTVKGTLVRDGEYHTLKIRVPKDKCQGDLHKIRFDPFPTASIGDTMYIKSMKFTTLDYPELGITNDMTRPGSENLSVANNYTESYIDYKENALALKVVGGTDVSVTFDFSHLFLSTQQYTGVEIEYMIPATNEGRSSAIYFTTSDNRSIDGKQVVSSGTLEKDGNYHVMTFDFMKKAEYWTGNIGTLRFDYFENTPAEGDVMYIKRITFIEAPGFDIDLTCDGEKDIFSSTKYTEVSFDETMGSVALTVSGGNDVSVTIDLSAYELRTADYSKLFVRYMIPTTNSNTSNSSTVYFMTDGSNSASEDKSVYCSVTVDGCYHTVMFDLSSKDTWVGNLVKIRFDYFQGNCVDGDKFYIESISLK